MFLAAVFSVIAASSVIGLLLTRWRVLPGTTAVWGSCPGAASAMTLMAEAFGADVRLVAFMQYLRVVLVTVVASVVARIWATPSGDHIASVVWFPPMQWTPFAETMALVGVGTFIAPLLRIPAGPMLVPMVAGSLAAWFRRHDDRTAAVAAGGKLRDCRLEHRSALHPPDTCPRPAGSAPRRGFDPCADRDLRRFRLGSDMGGRDRSADGLSRHQPRRRSTRSRSSPHPPTSMCRS